MEEGCVDTCRLHHLFEGRRAFQTPPTRAPTPARGRGGRPEPAENGGAVSLPSVRRVEVHSRTSSFLSPTRDLRRVLSGRCSDDPRARFDQLRWATNVGCVRFRALLGAEFRSGGSNSDPSDPDKSKSSHASQHTSDT